MLLWFAGGATALVWAVFRDPWLDYRLVVAGALVPDVADAVWGGAGPFHAVVLPVGALGAAMLVTRGRRVRRRQALAFVIGLFAHILLDGVWTSAEVFWWPFPGGEPGAQPLPWTDRPVLVVALQEVAGLVLAWLAAGFVHDARHPEPDGAA